MVTRTESPNLDKTNAATWPIWLTPEEVGQILDVSKLVVYQLCREKRIKSTKFGRRIRIHRDDLICSR